MFYSDALPPRQLKNTSFRFLTVIMIACLSGYAENALAVAGDSNAIEQVFCNAILIFTSTTGKAIATVAVIAVGVGALLGKISWGMALIVVLGVALMFGAASIVQALGGTASACTAGSILAT